MFLLLIVTVVARIREIPTLDLTTGLFLHNLHNFCFPLPVFTCWQFGMFSYGGNWDLFWMELVTWQVGISFLVGPV